VRLCRAVPAGRAAVVAWRRAVVPCAAACGVLCCARLVPCGVSRAVCPLVVSCRAVPVGAVCQRTSGSGRADISPQLLAAADRDVRGASVGRHVFGSRWTPWSGHAAVHGARLPGAARGETTRTRRSRADRTRPNPSRTHRGLWLSRTGLCAVYSSPMRRAWQTAQVIATTSGLDVRRDDRLRERMKPADRGLPGGLGPLGTRPRFRPPAAVTRPVRPPHGCARSCASRRTQPLRWLWPRIAASPPTCSAHPWEQGDASGRSAVCDRHARSVERHRRGRTEPGGPLRSVADLSAGPELS
jgi:hypothetical protein